MRDTCIWEIPNRSPIRRRKNGAARISVPTTGTIAERNSYCSGPESSPG